MVNYSILFFSYNVKILFFIYTDYSHFVEIKIFIIYIVNTNILAHSSLFTVFLYFIHNNHIIVIDNIHNAKNYLWLKFSIL